MRYRAVKSYHDSEDEDGSKQPTPHYNPLLAAHLGLGSDDVEGPLALLARNEVHPDDADRFKNILTKAKHKEVGQKGAGNAKEAVKTSAKTSVKKPIDQRERKPARTTAKSKTKPKTKATSTAKRTADAEPSTTSLEAQDSATSPVASNLSASLQDSERTKAAAEPPPRKTFKKTTRNAVDQSATSSSTIQHWNDVNVMEYPELNQNMDDLINTTAARAKIKLDAFRMGNTPTHDSSQGDKKIVSAENQEQYDVSGPRWAARNNELPSSVYQEEELSDNEFLRNTPEGDIPDPDYGAFLNFGASQEQGDKSIAPLATQVLLGSSDDMEVAVVLQEADLEELNLEPFSDTKLTVPQLVNHDEILDLMDGDLDDGALQDLVADLDGLDDVVDDAIHIDMQNGVPVEAEANKVSTGTQEDVVMSDFDFDEDNEWNMNLDLSAPDVRPGTPPIRQNKQPCSIAVPQSAAPSSPVQITPPASSDDIIVLDSSRPASPPTTPPSEPPPTTTPTFASSAITPPFLTPIPPIARIPFPPPSLDRSPIIGLTPSTLLRTCFRVGEALRVGMAACRENRVVIIELYARVLWSVRDSEKGVQTFEFGDLFHERRPWLKGWYEGWAGKEPWGYDAGLLVTGREEGETQMARVLGRVERDEGTGGWRLKIINVWMCDWEDVEMVRGIYC